MAGRKNKHAYLDDFEKDLNGNYQYRGAHYRYAGTPSRGRALAVLWLCCGGGAALTVGAGVLPGATAHAPVWLPLRPPCPSASRWRRAPDGCTGRSLSRRG